MAANEENEADIRLVIEDPSHSEPSPDELVLCSEAHGRTANLMKSACNIGTEMDHLKLELH